MSRYIEIDTALLKTVATGGLSAKALWKRIMEQPSIDIVRCKECKFSEVIQNDSSGVMARYCRAFTIPMMKAADDFCSYGEREGE